MTILALARPPRSGNERSFLLQRAQPAMTGLIDGSLSTLAPVFAVALATHQPRYAFFAGLATAIGAGVSMAFSEGLSDTGDLTGRGSPYLRGMITGTGTFLGGVLHTLPFLIPAYRAALAVAFATIAFELVTLAWIRWRFFGTGFVRSFISIAIAGFLLGALAGGRAAHALAAAHPGRWLAMALGGEALILAAAAVLTGAGVLPFAGNGMAGGGKYAIIAVLAVVLGVQNSTVRHLGAPDLTTTVLTLTLTGLTADSALAGGPGARPHRRLGSVAAMLAGAGSGAAAPQWWPPAAVITVAAVLVGGVAVAFMTTVPATARKPPHRAPHPVPQA